MMSDKPLISVVIPIYNVEDYINKCVESVRNQTFSNIEIVLVDDGSIDKSGLICDSLAKEDSRISVYHKHNGGLSDARNYGISKSNGEYITFVDGDDSLHLKALETMYDAATKENCAIVIGGLYIEYDDGHIEKEEPLCSDYVKRTNRESLAMIFSGKGYSACGKLYRTYLFEDTQFPVGKLDEDFATIYKLIAKTKYVAFIPEYVYYYYKRQGSITKSAFNVKKMDFFYNAESVYLEYQNDAYLGNIARAYLCTRIDRTMHLIVFDENREMYSSELMLLTKKMREQFLFILTSNIISLKDKIVYFSEMISPFIFAIYKKL
ncbi:glycosyltransferase family 2 protein [Oribacterium sp. P9]|uniref:glycosyltransferase family 2 protein n=1 Tax=Oribacterium sp. P9 TaxID=3378068 RepID=UPI003966CBDB